MTTVTAIYRTGNPRQWTVALSCGHKRTISNAELKATQLYVGKTVTCASCAQPEEENEPMNGLTITKHINLRLTADQWDLYNDQPGVNDAAIEMSVAVEEAVNAGLSRSEVVNQVMPVFERHSDHGAVDTEPLDKLERVLDAVFAKGATR